VSNETIYPLEEKKSTITSIITRGHTQHGIQDFEPSTKKKVNQHEKMKKKTPNTFFAWVSAP
jgi:hypothetical protein